MLFANPQAVYMKKDDDLEDAFYAGNKSAVKHHSPASTPGTLTPTGTLTPATGPSRSASSTDLKSTSSYAAISKPPGKLTSDLLASKRKPAAAPPKPDKYVYTTTGGTAMRGATKELSDLESALRTLEISTNPTLSTKRIPCPCQGTTHEVLLAAPNCLACGKIICIKEGLGPCTFCGTPLLTPEEVQDMVRSLREDAGREKMAINATQNRRAEVAKIPRPFTAAGEVGRVDEESLKKAQEHRDRLLGFQATSAQRTRIIDQAADFETPLAVGGLNQWATPAERALQLKRQQKTMRMMDWHAKEAYEKRKVVVAIDLKGRRVVKEMRTMEAPVESDDDEDASGPPEVDYTLGRGGKGKQKEGASSGGAFARNPLLKGLIKPVYVLPKEKKKGKGNLNVDEAIGGLGGYASGRDNKWRRVQDSLGDNERVILDGGIQGGAGEFEMSDEIACG